jgi:hypothetical protein
MRCLVIAIVAEAPIRSGGNYSIGTLAWAKSKCCSRVALCAAQDFNYAEQISDGVHYGIYRGVLGWHAAFSYSLLPSVHDNGAVATPLAQFPGRKQAADVQL